jgi:hypothetical protein
MTTSPIATTRRLVLEPAVGSCLKPGASRLGSLSENVSAPASPQSGEKLRRDLILSLGCMQDDVPKQK